MLTGSPAGFVLLGKLLPVSASVYCPATPSGDALSMNPRKHTGYAGGKHTRFSNLLLLLSVTHSVTLTCRLSARKYAVLIFVSLTS